MIVLAIKFSSRHAFRSSTRYISICWVLYPSLKPHSSGDNILFMSAYISLDKILSHILSDKGRTLIGL